MEYGWKRFLCPRGGSIKLSNDGYLQDPEESECAKYYQPDIVTFSDI